MFEQGHVEYILSRIRRGGTMHLPLLLSCVLAVASALNFGHKPWPKDKPRPSHVVSALREVKVPASWSWSAVQGVNYLTQVELVYQTIIICQAKKHLHHCYSKGERHTKSLLSPNLRPPPLAGAPNLWPIYRIVITKKSYKTCLYF